MTKHSKHEQAKRAAEDERMREIGAAWTAQLTPERRAEFAEAVAVAHARPRRERPADQPPGTLPNPPRPGREPKAAKDEERRPRRW